MPDSLQIVKKFFPDVERVKDATKDITVEVTPADVKAADMKDHKGCAMAVACKRALKLDGAVVSLGTVYLVKDELALRYRVPHSLSRELVAFDRGGSFAPGVYDLRKPERTAQRGQGARQRPKEARPMGKKGAHHMTASVRTSLLSV